MKGKDALLVADIQNDFCPGGALPVEKGDLIIPVINRLMAFFPVVAAIQDWHPKGHRSFASTHPGKKPYDVVQLSGVEQVLWPDHCVQGTEGAELHGGLEKKAIQAIFRKGMNPDVDSYSGFRDNSKKAVTGLDGYLKALGVRKIHIVGLATDYCVFFTAMDGLENGYETSIIIDATAGIDVPRGSMTGKLSKFEARGGRIRRSTEEVIGDGEV